jgi:hypothetical protein
LLPLYIWKYLFPSNPRYLPAYVGIKVIYARFWCNPSYSGGRDQKDHSLKPARVNSSWDPISKKATTKKGLVEWLKVRPWVQTPVPQINNK